MEPEIRTGKTYYARQIRAVREGTKLVPADVTRFMHDSGPWAEITDVKITTPDLADMLGMDVRYIEIAGYKLSTRNGDGETIVRGED